MVKTHVLRSVNLKGCNMLLSIRSACYQRKQSRLHNLESNVRFSGENWQKTDHEHTNAESNVHDTDEGGRTPVISTVIYTT